MPPYMDDRFKLAMERFDAANSEDPNTETQDGLARPRELVYSQWLMDWVLRLKPDASEPLRLAARAQHICRWRIPRESYPRTREAYLKWREDLKKLHATTAGSILRQTGYNEEEIERVQALIRKKLFPTDEEARVLEDALCLVFLERQFGELAAKTSHDKMVNALRKCWKKMSAAARQMALTFPYTPEQKNLLDAALVPEREKAE